MYLFALGQAPEIDVTKAILIFFILHLLVYPASNGYNSYMDQDETPIGGLKKPLQPTRQLFTATLLMDVAGIILSLLISRLFALGILLYIVASRAYSYRPIRLKQYAIPGFLLVFTFQGAVIFFLTWFGVYPHLSSFPFLPCVISSLLIGALYPLTQIYQHQADKNDNVTSISYLLGKRGTFVFSMMLFLTATVLMYLNFEKNEQRNQFFWYLLLMLPVVLFFLYWMMKVWRNDEEANFKNSLMMNLVSTTCTSIFFLTLILLNH